ncbi:MAG: YlbF family regulator [Coprobacillus sp.]|nr:YlbF family regulator [Coprobacillus sp.]
MEKELYELTYALKDDLNNSSTYQKLLKLEKEVNESEEVKRLSKEMNEASELYNSLVNIEGEAQKEAQRKFSETKARLYNYPLVKEYNETLKEYRELLNKINEEIISPLRINTCQKK